jgi:hypothetical protein
MATFPFVNVVFYLFFRHLKKLYYARDTYAHLFSLAAVGGIVALFGFIWIKSSRVL